jgi:hypothetical protein
MNTYEDERTLAWINNTEEVKSWFRDGLSIAYIKKKKDKEIEKKIKRLADETGHTEEEILRHLYESSKSDCIDSTILFHQIAKNPTKQSLGENHQKENINNSLGTNCEKVKDIEGGTEYKHNETKIWVYYLPKKGKNARYLDNNGCVVKEKPEDIKSIDAVIIVTCENLMKKFYITMKHTDDDGGHQKNVKIELHSFIKNANKNSDANTYFVICSDGNNITIEQTDLYNEKCWVCTSCNIVDNILTHK